MLKKDFFKNSGEVIQASAPGRMDVMGGVADYSGSLLLQMPISERTTISLAWRKDSIVRVYSASAEEHGSIALIEVDLKNFVSAATPDYTAIRNEIKKIPGGDWGAYVVGCFVILIYHKFIPIQGADIFVESDVPIGKGVSSSAALEVATMSALKKLYSFKIGKLELPILAQKVENLIVGAPCGLMDQVSSYLGEKDKLLPIICQPAEVFDTVGIPAGVRFVGIDSDVKHSVAGAHYSNVRAAAFTGYTIIARMNGVAFEDLENAANTGEWDKLPYKGYLANISVDDFEKKYQHELPEEITGKDFLSKYKISIDKVTTIDSNETYKIKKCAAHPVYENDRLVKFKAILMNVEKGEKLTTEMLAELGQYMYESHLSYSQCGLGNEFTDEIVEMVIKSGYASGVYGAKITGGGSGGTVCILTYQEKGMNTAMRLKEIYEKKYNKKVVFFKDSSNGAFYE